MPGDSTKFSIITINYNNVKELEKTFESVFRQTFKGFEYIVIDGNSSDGGKELIEQFANKIDYWISEPDNGVYDAMNKGIAKAKGDFLYFLNSGDTFYSNEVLFKVNKLIEVYNPDIIYGNVNDIEKDAMNSAIRKKGQLDKIELFHKMVCHQGLFCHKRLFVDNRFNINYKIKADYDWLLNTITIYKPKIYSTNLVIANYLLGGLSDAQYNKYSVKEIPQIRNYYFTYRQQQFLRRYVFNPNLKRLPLGNFIRHNFKRFFRLIIK